MITVLDCGLGNIGSVVNMLRKIGREAEVTNDVAAVDRAEALVLPGVGAFDRGSEALTRLGLRDPLRRRVFDDGVPFLGICLGMQLLARGSEEGDLPGLGWIDADVTRLTPNGLPVPHMGWNHVDPVRPTALLPDDPTPRFYFVHSYRMVCDRDEDVLATTTYGEPFTCAVAVGNVLGVQFHPEKSHAFGVALLETWTAGVVEGTA